MFLYPTRWFPFLMSRACCEACGNLKAAFLVAVVGFYFKASLLHLLVVVTLYSLSNPIFFAQYLTVHILFFLVIVFSFLILFSFFFLWLLHLYRPCSFLACRFIKFLFPKHSTKHDSWLIYRCIICRFFCCFAHLLPCILLMRFLLL